MIRILALALVMFVAACSANREPVLGGVYQAGVRVPVGDVADCDADRERCDSLIRKYAAEIQPAGQNAYEYEKKSSEAEVTNIEFRERFCKEFLFRNGVDVTGGGRNQYGQNGTKIYKACMTDDLSYPFDQFSIALSGGGARSASFSMGVLKALSKADYLEDANVISSVSGGGYTSFWYYMQHYNAYLFEKAEKISDDMEERCEREHLRTHDRFYVRSESDGLERARQYSAFERCMGNGRYQEILKELNRKISYPDEGRLPLSDVSRRKYRDVMETGFCKRVVTGNRESHEATNGESALDEGREFIDLKKRIFRTMTDGHLLSGSNRYQRHVASQSDIINYSGNDYVQMAETGGLVLSHVATLPFYWVTDGVLNTGIYNGSVFSNAYRKGLERTYGLAPNEQYKGYLDYKEHAPKQFLNARRGEFLFWREASRISEIEFKDLRAFVQAYNICSWAQEGLRGDQGGRPLNSGDDKGVSPMPLPLVNTKLTRPASMLKDPGHNDAKSLEKSVFSFSPLNWGSRYTGYIDDAYDDAPVTFSKAVAVSGAAVDKGARQLEGLGGAGTSILNINLGHDVPNPKYHRWSPGTPDPYLKVINWVAGGFPLKYIIPEQGKTRLRLSDGGHAENLGLFPLIDRHTRRIILVDAEHDESYGFDGFQRIRYKLADEWGLNVECIGACPKQGDFMNNKGAAVFRLRVSRNRNDGERFLLLTKGRETADDAGEICEVQDKNLVSEIIYVKLSINVNHSKLANGENCTANLGDLTAGTRAALPCNVLDYYRSEEGKDGNAFPHNSTADIWYGEEQYRAYRDLGYYIGITELADVLKDSDWRNDIDRGAACQRERMRRYLESAARR